MIAKNTPRALLSLILFMTLLMQTACAEEIKEEPEVRLPDREHTWVRKETMKKTKEDMFATKETKAPIPINPELKQQLTQVSNSSASNKDSLSGPASCLKRLDAIDKKRIAVQKTGGMWHTFERSPEVKEYSANGVQLDSQTNQLVFALKHLCKTAKGIPQTGLAIVLSREVSTKGREAVRKELIELGEAAEDVENWLNHEDYFRKNAKRDLSYDKISNLIVRTERVVNLYEELSKKEVDKSSKDSFLSDAVTLLEVVQDLLVSNKYISLALSEDLAIPSESLGEM